MFFSIKLRSFHGQWKMSKLVIRVKAFLLSSMLYRMIKYMYSSIKPAYNDNPWDSNIVVVVDGWSFFRGQLCHKSSKLNVKMVPL